MAGHGFLSLNAVLANLVALGHILTHLVTPAEWPTAAWWDQSQFQSSDINQMVNSFGAKPKLFYFLSLILDSKTCEP